MKKTPAPTPAVKYEQQPVTPPLPTEVLLMIAHIATDEVRQYIESQRTDEPILAARLASLAEGLQGTMHSMARDNDTLLWYEATEQVDECRYALETIAKLRNPLPFNACGKRREDERNAAVRP